MKVAFSELTEIGISSEIRDDGWFPREVAAVGGEIEGTVTVRRTGDLTAEVTGVIAVETLTSCDRCTRSLQRPLESRFVYECIVGSEEKGAQQESECREEDFNRIYLEESVINIGDILREQVLLNLPVQSLCNESCRGLCSACGANLNSESCVCEESKLSSQFSVLRKIKGR